METNNVIVQDAEAFFLSGNFSKALMLSNQVLKQEWDNNDNFQNKIMQQGQAMMYDKSFNYDEQIILSLSTPVRFHFETTSSPITRKMSIVFPPQSPTTKVSSIDRAAAVALQSWFEIARRSKQKQQKVCSSITTQHLEHGFFHLKPFLDVYAPPITDLHSKQQSKEHTSSTKQHHQQHKQKQSQQFLGRPMPPALMIIFLQFLRAIGGNHMHAATDLSVEILHSILHDEDNQQKNAKIQSNVGNNINANEFCQEIFLILCTELLPCLTEPKEIQQAFQQCFSSHDKSSAVVAVSGQERSTAATTTTTTSDQTMMNPRAIQTLLSLLNTIPITSVQQQEGIGPTEECLATCKSELKRLLKFVKMQQHQTKGMQSPSSQSRDQDIVAQANNNHVNTISSERNHTIITNTSRSNRRSPIFNWLSNNMDPIVTRFMYVLKNKDLIIQKIRNNPSTIALWVLMILLAWKRRKRLMSMSGTAIRHVLAPLQEIIEAVTKTT